MDHKVFVMLGFHINFYHSWRGDTPDEAGFGTDMRVIRGILDLLERANTAGKKARGYWDTEVYWTFQEILPKHCPDILERMRSRVAAGLDEIVLGPFNNGANHAATASEFRAAVDWAIENPWGSGLRQLFPRVTSFYRPQESVFTIGQEKILKECGVTGLMLYYALVPFNTLGVFTPALSLERRYNPFWFRSREDQPQLIVFPAMSAADVLEMASLENMMLDLHARQQRGEIRSDVVIHLNEDADLESWLPFQLPRALKWFPNTGGLEEYIRLVNKYPWADFTVPSEYLAAHPPQGEVLVRQDLADGAFDGSYSWAEKCSSLRIWTILEQSRLASCRAEALARRSGVDVNSQLWEGLESSFFKRLVGLTTTHFGMSTPVINEERQARAFSILGDSLRIARDAECAAAERLVTQTASLKRDAIYEFEIFPTPPDREIPPQPSYAAIRLPMILPMGVSSIDLQENGSPIPVSLTDQFPLSDGRLSCELRFVVQLDPPRVKGYQIFAYHHASPAHSVTYLRNKWLEVLFSDQAGIKSLKYNGKKIAGLDFLQPFVSYRKNKNAVVYPVTHWEFIPLAGEHWERLHRVRMQASIPMQTIHGEFTNVFTYTFTLHDELPYLFVDVEARYAHTPSTETIHNLTQKLRRRMDLRWVEVAPFQLHPPLHAAVGKPLRIWKHNYMGITAYYDLDYARINPRNRNLDSFNHQVTAGWVAVTDRKRGFLLGESAASLASMAFCPMRLREHHGIQQLWLNPFGSYFGRQASYSHLGATGLGTEFLKAFSGFLKPNGPSYNGQTLPFSLMLAPYTGDEPPAELQADAGAHFYPPAILFHACPDDMNVLLPSDISTIIENEKRTAAIAAVDLIPDPSAFLANPSNSQVDLVWDPPRDVPLTGYEVAWREEGDLEWHTQAIEPSNRWQIPGLMNGKLFYFRLRGICGSKFSGWTPEQSCIPGAVTGSSLGGNLAQLPFPALLRLVAGSLWSVLRALSYSLFHTQPRS